MRTREEIRSLANASLQVMAHDAPVGIDLLILEVALDIRDLLMQGVKTETASHSKKRKEKKT